MTITITPNEGTNPPGKLADAALHFTDGPLAGLKLIGFGIWRRPHGGFNVTFPARTYTVNSERRSFALLRPIDAASTATLREAMIDAWLDYHRADDPHCTCNDCGEGEARHATQ